MPRINQQEAQALFDPDATQPMPRVSNLVDRRRGADRRQTQDWNSEEVVGATDRRRKKRRRTDAR